ncbi:MAG: hypothetical protein JJLCMIEE_00297 [Acidimicrobiales bacterium]|nr:MAG: hypothetical protein EDR02_01750 [Actinomycetota bacterium]MBV6507256.1 hypothetical protein [Acidimicrobiales bacterium]RIK04134.1 MAG: hypothetical protein DCC48_14555 [Acidobacteriota bacterium]
MSRDTHERADCNPQTILARPTALLTEFRGVFPRFYDRGRGQAAVIRTAGRFAVKRISTYAERGLATFQLPAVQRNGLHLLRRRNSDAGGEVRRRAQQPESTGVATRTKPQATPPRDTGGVDPETLAIHDYDSLAASQVVARLNGLEADQLEAVRRYENATRGRKTILNKIAQLQRP